MAASLTLKYFGAVVDPAALPPGACSLERVGQALPPALDAARGATGFGTAQMLGAF